MNSNPTIKPSLTKPALVLLIFLFCVSSLSAEGTKQFRPTSSDVGNMEINDQGRPFALESNADPLHRLYFHISNVSERVYFGFQHLGSGTATYRIKAPDGTIKVASTTIPSSGAGYIDDYNKAVVGPKIGGSPSGGYSPIVFYPDVTGDFYIEFTTSLSDTYHFDLFDLTVTTSSNVPINGRLWSYAWDFSTRSSSGRYNGDLYVYTADGYVSKVDMNGIQPHGFVVACNNTGPSNIAGGNNENRKSVAGNSTRPEHKIFLNEPDITCYPNGSTPTVIDNLSVVGTPVYGQPIHFSLNISMAGTIQIVLDINATPGYQTNSEDVIIVENVSTGLNEIIWDGKDGFGNYVSGATVLVLSSFTTGVTHLPIFDPETHENGYIVTRIRPFTGSCELYWDDSNFSGGTVNIDGLLTTGHCWPASFGNERTINTWWNGYELDVLNNFQFYIPLPPLPIQLINFGASHENGTVKIEWTTLCEINNAYFIVEKSDNLIHFAMIEAIEGAGNSNSPIHYTVFDNFPNSTSVYYRLKQIDYNGDYSYSDIITLAPSSIFNVIFQNTAERGSSIMMQLENVNAVSAIYLIHSNSTILTMIDNISENIQLEAPAQPGIYYIKISYTNGDSKIFKLLVY